MQSRFVLLGLIVPATAAASPLDGVYPHVSFGLEAAGDGQTALYAGRFYAGASVGLGHGDVTPSIGLGVTAAAGEIMPDDPTLPSHDYRDAGPELQLGLRFGPGPLVSNRVFASLAILAMPRPADDTIARAATALEPARYGYRVAVGASISGWTFDLAQRMPHGYLFAVMLPQQLEIEAVRDATTTRYGVTLSFGL